MGDKRIEIVTESMFYVLLAFRRGECGGVDVTGFVEELTGGRVRLGPATLYTILGRFEQEKILVETRTEGRKRIYRLTEKGQQMYEKELHRMESCLADAARADKGSW